MRLAYISDPLLQLRFLGSIRPRRQLQNGRSLTIAEQRQQHDLAIGEFEGVVMRRLFVLVDLTKNCRAMAERSFTPREQAGGEHLDVPSKRQLGARQDTNGDARIFRSAKAAGPRPKVMCGQFVGNVGGPRFNAI